VTFPRRGVYRQEAPHRDSVFLRLPAESAPAKPENRSAGYPPWSRLRIPGKFLPAWREKRFESLTRAAVRISTRCATTSPRQCAHVHWEGFGAVRSLMVREFTREDDCRILLSSILIYPRKIPRAEAGRFRIERSLRACRQHLRSLRGTFTKTILCCNSAGRRWKLLSLPLTRLFSPSPAPGRRTVSSARPQPIAHGRSRNNHRTFQNHRDPPPPRLRPRAR